jgi:hypothetical protein
VEIEQNFTGVIRGWEELKAVTNMKRDRISTLMITEGFPKGHLTQAGKLRMRMWDRTAVTEWLEKKNA